MKVFSEEQQSEIPVDYQAGENYLGDMSQQLRNKGESASNSISDRLVLKPSSDPAFGMDAANMLKYKEFKSKQQEIIQIEAGWSRVQKGIMKSKLSLTDAEADKLKKRNGKMHKYMTLLSSQADRMKSFDRIKKVSQKDQLSFQME